MLRHRNKFDVAFNALGLSNQVIYPTYADGIQMGGCGRIAKTIQRWNRQYEAGELLPDRVQRRISQEQ